MIKIENLIKRYGERTVLDIPALETGEGETVALAGANGSGKSTLLKILSGLAKATEGNIEVPQDRMYMPQQSYAFRGTLTDNILIGNADRKEAEELLEKTDLIHLADKKASSLSGGELQRLSLCRLLARKCSLLLLDEPTASCDARGAELVVQAIKEYRERYGCTVIMSTHSPALALSAAERLIVLNNGKIEADGNPREILTSPGSEWAKSFVAGWKI